MPRKTKPSKESHRNSQSWLLLELLKYPFKNSIILFLLLSRSIMQVAADSQENKQSLSNYEDQQVQPNFLLTNGTEERHKFRKMLENRSVNLIENLNEALAKKDFILYAKVLDDLISIHGEKEELLVKKVEAYEHMGNDINKLKWLYKLYDVNPKSEFCLARLLNFHMTSDALKFNDKVKRYAEELCQIELASAFGFFAKGNFLTTYGMYLSKKGKINSVLYDEGIENFNKALALEPENELFRDVLSQCLSHPLPKQFSVNFSRIYNEKYTFLLNSSSANAFHQNEGNKFDYSLIEQAVNEGFGLILNTQTELPTLIGKKVTAPLNAYQPFILLPRKGDYCYYISTYNDFELSLFYSKYLYSKTAFTKVSLQKSVTGFLTTEGRVIADAELLRGVLEARVKSAEQSWITYAMTTVSTVISAYVGYKGLGYINKRWAQRVRLRQEYSAQQQEQKDQLNELAQQIVKQSENLLSLEWNIEKNILKISNFAVPLLFEINPALSKNFEGLTVIKLDPEGVKKLWVENLQRCFGKAHIVEEVKNKQIKITPDYQKLPALTTLEEKFTRLQRDVISQSQEYQLILIKQNFLKIKRQFLEKKQQLVYKLSQKIASSEFIIEAIRENLNHNNKAVNRKANELYDCFNKIKSLQELLLVHEDQKIEIEIILKINLFQAEIKKIEVEFEDLISFLDTEKFINLKENINALEEQVKLADQEAQQAKALMMDETLFKKIDELKKDYDIAIKKAENSDSQVKSRKLDRGKNSNIYQTPEEINAEFKKPKIIEEKKKAAEQRKAALTVLKNQEKQKIEQQKKSEEEEKRRKEEADAGVERSRQLAIKEERKQDMAKKIPQDTRFHAVDTNLSFIKESLDFIRKPEESMFLTLCQKSPSLSKKIKLQSRMLTQNSLLYSLMRAAHGLGQLLNEYKRHGLIDIDLCYRVRDALMHFSPIILNNPELLIEGSQEFVKLLDPLLLIIKKASLEELKNPLVFQSQLFSYEFLKKLKNRDSNISKLKKFIKIQLNNLVIMYEIGDELYSLNKDSYLHGAGFLHQAMNGCVNTLGQAFKELAHLDSNAYEELQEAMIATESELFMIKGELRRNIFEETRLKAGHYFTSDDSFADKVRVKQQSENVIYAFEPLSAINLYYLGRDCETLLMMYPDLFTPKLRKSVVKGGDSGFFSNKTTKKNDSDLNPNAETFVPVKGWDMPA